MGSRLESFSCDVGEVGCWNAFVGGNDPLEILAELALAAIARDPFYHPTWMSHLHLHISVKFIGIRAHVIPYGHAEIHENVVGVVAASSPCKAYCLHQEGTTSRFEGVLGRDVASWGPW